MAEVFIYRNVGSNGARDLAREAGWKRCLNPPPARRGDFVVCWGTPVARTAGVRYLNNVPLQNKYEDAVKLKAAGVATIEVALQPQRRQIVAAPIVRGGGNIRNFFDKAMEMASDFVENDAPDFNSPVFKVGINEFRDAIVALDDALRVPGRHEAPREVPAVVGEWLGRRFHHVGGKDLLGLNRQPPQYFALKEDIVEEFRIHSFKGKSIRAGKKVIREDVPANRRHAWIRSWDGGWRMAYEGVRGNPELRNLAHAAVTALGLDFGAVDIGKRRNGTFFVLEVNRAPGIEAGTVTKYKEAIQEWMQG